MSCNVCMSSNNGIFHQHLDYAHEMVVETVMLCRATVNQLGYSPLNDKDEAEDYSINAKKRQEHFEAETERILMDTYNALYKCQEFIPMVCQPLG